MKDGREVTIRPIRAEDEPLMRKFHEALSDRTVYLRYLSPMVLSERVTHERLARMTHNDYDREIALVVEGDEAGEKAVFGVARLSKFRGENDEARFTMLVNDKFQGQGLGKELLKRLLDVAKAEKIKRVIAIISPENEAMQKLCRELGFSSMQADSETGMVKAEISL
jgi:acetyltransferase